MTQPYWPNAADYGEVLQNPAANFRDARICAGQAVTDARQRPLRWTGNFAAVFQVRGASVRQNWAVKCFTRRVAGLQERYRQIDLHLREQRQRLSFLVGFDYLSNELLVRGERYPVLKMDWVEGLCLDKFLLDCFENGTAKGTLPVLCEMWVKLAQRLRDAQVAHGDLQHGNVLLVPDPDTKGALNLRLIDYDGMYVPALSDQTPGEVGHRAYQHRQRLSQGGYGPEIDRFSHLLIYTTLRCLIVGGRELWDRHYDEDRLLLGPQDLADPDQSPVFRDLWRLEDPAARNLVGHLALAAHGRLEDVPLLEEVLRDRKVVALTLDQERQVEQWLSTGGPSAQMRPSREQEPARPPPTTAPAAPARAPVVVTCVCGRSFAAAPHLCGQQVPCPMCGWLLDIPVAPGGSAKRPLETSLANTDPLGSVLPPAASRPLTRTPFRAQPHRGEANPFVELACWAKPRWPLLTALGGGVLTVLLLLSLVAGVWRGSESLPVATGVTQTGSGQPAAEDPMPAVSPADAAAASALGDAQEEWTSARAAADQDLMAKYAAAQWKAAQDEARSAESEASSGKSEQATTLYRRAIDLLTRANTEAPAARQRAEEADSLVTQCKSAIAAADKPAAELLLAKLEKLAPQDARLADLRQACGRIPPRIAPPNSPTATTLPSISNSIGMKLVLIPSGEFLMGSSGSDGGARSDEKPQHRVRITKPFYLGLYEVTQAQYEKVVGNNPSKFKGKSLPVEAVSWEDAVAFCKRLSKVAEERRAGRSYRLPTEAEWEYACRAGSTSKYFFGDAEAELEKYAWYDKNWGKKRHPVGEKQANAWGLYDTHGNLLEWCQDWYGPYAAGAASDPLGPGVATYRVLRGGCIGADGRDCRSASRGSNGAGDGLLITGFRVAGVRSDS